MASLDGDATCAFLQPHHFNPTIGVCDPEEGEVKANQGKGKAEYILSSTKELSELPASARQVYAALKEDSSMTYDGLQAKLGFSTAAIAKAIFEESSPRSEPFA